MRKKKVTLWDLLGKVPDHRNTLGRRYSLRSVLAITLAAVFKRTHQPGSNRPLRPTPER